MDEKKGLFPSTEWKKQAIGQNWYLGETFITGIGQGYIQTSPLQLCLMTAQLANGGYKIYPKIIAQKDQISVDQIKYKMLLASQENKEANSFADSFEKVFDNKIKEYTPLFRNPENIKFVLDAMFKSTNEIYGTSYSSRIDDPKYQFAGKTGTAK